MYTVIITFIPFSHERSMYVHRFQNSQSFSGRCTTSSNNAVTNLVFACYEEKKCYDQDNGVTSHCEFLEVGSK